MNNKLCSLVYVAFIITALAYNTSLLTRLSSSGEATMFRLVTGVVTLSVELLLTNFHLALAGTDLGLWADSLCQAIDPVPHTPGAYTQHGEKRTAVLVALLLHVKIEHEQFVPYVAAHAAQPAPNRTTPIVTSLDNSGLLPSPVYGPSFMPSWLKSRDVHSAADGDNTTCCRTSLYTSTDWSEAYGWNASSGIAAVTVDNVSARAGPLIPVQHGSKSDNSNQYSVDTMKLPAVQNDPAASRLEEEGHAKHDIGDLYFVDMTVTPNHTNDEASEDPLTIEPVTKPTLRSKVTLRGTFLILLAIVFTYGTYSWPVGVSDEARAATKQLHFHPKPKRGSARRKSRKRKNHQPKPKKLQVLESIREHPEEQSELAPKEEAQQAPLTADHTTDIASTLAQSQEEVAQADQPDMKVLSRGKPRGVVAAWTCKVLQRKMRIGKDSTSITDAAQHGHNPILDSAQDFEVEMSVAATDSLPVHQAPPQGMEQPMANSNTVYQDATLVAKKPVISGRVLAQKGKRVMSKAKTSVAAVKTRLLRCCHPVVVS